MDMRGGLPMVTKRDARIVDQVVVVYRSVMEDKLMFSIVIRVCFICGFCSIWNSSPSRV